MNFYKLFFIVWLVLPQNALSGPREPYGGMSYNKELFSFSDRSFLVGDLRKAVGQYDKSFSLRKSYWLAGFVNNDLVLHDWQVKFFWSGFPSLEMAGELPRHIRKNKAAIKITDPTYIVSGFIGFQTGSKTKFYFPKEGAITYSATCAVNYPDSDFNFCRIYAAYPYDTHIMLTAHKIVPGRLEDVAPSFKGIAYRMIEIATCLDITNTSDDAQPRDISQIEEGYPNLTGCRIEITS